MAAPKQHTDITIIGGGQAGLAMGYHLRSLPHTFQILERNARVGDSWRRRYDSLKLFSPREYSSLPGLAVPGKRRTFPTRDEIADYLEMYAEHFTLPVVTGKGASKLVHAGDGFSITLDDGSTVSSRVVIIAAGAFQQPSIPSIAQKLSHDVVQFSAGNYKNPSQVPAGTVLVVGDGATGRQIAFELCRTHKVYLATGRLRSVTPDYILGMNNFWWMELLHLSRASRESLVGKYFMKLDPFPGLHLMHMNLRRHGITIVGRLAEAEGNRVTFSRGGSTTIASVVWATGYHDRTEWVEIPQIKDAHGRFVERRGVTALPNLFFIGRSWQWTRGSALLFGVTRDAEYLVPFIQKGLLEG